MRSHILAIFDLEGAKKWLAENSTREEINPLYASYPTTLEYREVHSGIGKARNKIKPRPMDSAPEQPRLF